MCVFASVHACVRVCMRACVHMRVRERLSRRRQPLAWGSQDRERRFLELCPDGAGQRLTLSNLRRSFRVGQAHTSAEPATRSVTRKPWREAGPVGRNPGRGCVLGGAWPASRSGPGAGAEARDRPRSASRAGGERLEAPGVGSDKGCLQGGSRPTSEMEAPPPPPSP